MNTFTGHHGFWIQRVTNSGTDGRNSSKQPQEKYHSDEYNQVVGNDEGSVGVSCLAIIRFTAVFALHMMH